MLHNKKKAYECFSMSMTAQTDGNFMRLGMQTNLALALYAQGKTEDAKQILDQLIAEYNQGNMQTGDTLVYCATMINRGYFAYVEKDYYKAFELYKESLMHEYRYQNDLQHNKRTNMYRAALRHIMNGDKKDSIDNIDFTDQSDDFYQKPYSLIPFAFYVL